MANSNNDQTTVVGHPSTHLYNKVRMFVMLAGFTFVTLVAISHSGNVSDTCRSEWNFLRKGEAGTLRSAAVTVPVSASGESAVNGACDAGEIETKASRLPDLDLILPSLLFGF